MNYFNAGSIRFSAHFRSTSRKKREVRLHTPPHKLTSAVKLIRDKTSMITQIHRIGRPKEMFEIPPPDPFIIHYHYDSGSMPPPHHHGYVIHIGPGKENRITYWPDYPGENTPLWEHSFSVEKAALQGLYQLMLEKRLMLCRWGAADAQPSGGSQEWAEITCNRILVKIPANLTETEARDIAPVYQAIKNLVPAEIWEDLKARQRQYISDSEQHGDG